MTEPGRPAGEIGHVAFVDTTLYVAPAGGAHTFLVHLCGGLARRGIRVSVVTEPGPDPAVANAATRAGATVVRSLWSRRHLSDERAARVAEWVRREAVQVFVVSVSPDAGWLTLPLLDAGVATVSIAHNDVGAFYEPLRYYAPFVDRAVGVSRAIHERLVAECGLPPARAAYVPYGVPALAAGAADRRVGQARAGPLQLGYVGRLVQEQKRILDLAALVADLHAAGVPFHLHVVGDGPDRARFESALRAAGVASPVTVWGWLPRDEVHARLAQLDVLVLMSEYEGLPVAVLEAMGQAVVPVLTHIGSGNTQLVSDGVNGRLLPVGDVGGFTRAVQDLARDPERLAALRRAAWRTAGEYSVERMVDSYVELFRSAGRPPRAPRPAGPVAAMPSCRSRFPRWARKLRALALGAGR